MNIKVNEANSLIELRKRFVNTLKSALKQARWKEDRIHNNNITTAIYNALFYENRNRNKALVTFTVGDERLNSLIELRREFLKILNYIMKRAAWRDGRKIAYFTNIEFGKNKGALETIDFYSFNPHMHIQFFYDDFTPIKLALTKLFENRRWNNLKNFSHDTANDNQAYLGYVIKDYLLENYCQEYEENKTKRGMGQKLHTQSRNWITSYAITYIYSYLKKHLKGKWKAMKKELGAQYRYVAEHIKKGNIIITDIDENLPIDYKIVKNSAIYINIDNLLNG